MKHMKKIVIFLSILFITFPVYANRMLDNFHYAHKIAAEVTGKASSYGSHHQNRFHSYQTSQKSTYEDIRRNGKYNYCVYLKDLEGLLLQSVHSHANAISSGDGYLKYYGNEPAAASVRNVLPQLRTAKNSISSHADSIKKEYRGYRCHIGNY